MTHEEKLKLLSEAARNIRQILIKGKQISEKK